MSFLSSLTSERQTILFAAVGLALFLLVTGLFPDIGRTRTRTAGLAPGRKIDAHITLVTADANDLACAGEVEVAGARCAFRKDGSPADVRGPVLAPYMTVDNVLFLVPDLWSEPALARRLATDPPNVPREQLRRFTARCEMTIRGKAEDFYVRWQPTADWHFHDQAWVGSIAGCSID